MWENPLDSMEIFAGSPVSKWKEIIFNSSRGLSESELERLLETLAMYEILLEEDDIQVNLRDFFQKSLSDDNLKSKINERKNSLAIESMSKILSENE
ncbi:DUF2018 family protein [Helicobacter saguini]|uniref:DUF2018 family protein n=1 Tax=Helicobacter saguini TaxID=1548018 RepID=A0A347VSE4_9HELI|nr:DUF2018 family protein [Helicobacter saguini]MWV62541.1 DUF2018 family protein [Helicobacter saguini]MWV66785.1 DUF2018 family protein [Helicobacter saguini]MWV69136.1 DUF2018 family protein [Helicobacter saguini]MWV71309.1 DUF2018 family protein [Helicobacter saguini]TLD94180.1 DUF2018 family protein [Helicobacter saguini]